MNNTIRIVDLGFNLTEAPNYQDLSAFDPGENQTVDISPGYFENKKTTSRIDALKWALRKVKRLIDLDKIVTIARNNDLDKEIRSEAVTANKRILNYYARTRFTDGNIVVPASSRRVIMFCEESNMELKQ